MTDAYEMTETHQIFCAIYAPRFARIIGLSQLPIARTLTKRETVAVGHSQEWRLQPF